MRHTLISLAAMAVVSGFAFGAGPAKAAPIPKLDNVASQTATAEAVRYYRRRGYRPYRYRRPYYAPRYRYYAPRRYYGYRPYYRGYGYRPYYRGYGRPYYRGYRYRPRYGRRYW